MKKSNYQETETLTMEINGEDLLALLNRLLERLRQADLTNFGSHLSIVYVASGAQHVDTVQNQYQLTPLPNPPRRRGNDATFDSPAESIRHCISLLMLERYGDEPLFNQQSHWQAIYRILVDKGYCSDSDFDGFDIFIRTVMPEEVNKPYRKESVKNISQTDFGKPFELWRFDPETSKTRKPFNRMVAVAKCFKETLEENGL